MSNPQSVEGQDRSLLCRADFDSSGVIDFQDFLAFAAVMNLETPSRLECDVFRINVLPRARDTIKIVVRDTIRLTRVDTVKVTTTVWDTIVEYQDIEEEPAWIQEYVSSGSSGRYFCADGELVTVVDDEVWNLYKARPLSECVQRTEGAQEKDCTSGWRKTLLDFATVYGRNSSNPDFDSNFDKDGDGDIDFSDLLSLVAELDPYLSDQESADLRDNALPYLSDLAQFRIMFCGE